MSDVTFHLAVHRTGGAREQMCAAEQASKVSSAVQANGCVVQANEKMDHCFCSDSELFCPTVICDNSTRESGIWDL